MDRGDGDVGKIDRAVVREAQKTQWSVVIVEIEAGLSFVVPAVDLDLGKPPSMREGDARSDEEREH